MMAMSVPQIEPKSIAEAIKILTNVAVSHSEHTVAKSKVYAITLMNHRIKTFLLILEHLLFTEVIFVFHLRRR